MFFFHLGNRITEDSRFIVLNHQKGLLPLASFPKCSDPLLRDHTYEFPQFFLPILFEIPPH